MTLDAWLWTIRGAVSELVSEGHPSAPDYPIAFVLEEVEIIAERKNRWLASEATVLHSAINTAVASFGKDGGRKAHSLFKKLVNRLAGSGAEVPPPFPPTTGDG